MIPELVSPKDQLSLLSNMLHKQLADQRHKTNVHLHHSLPYQACNEKISSISDSEYSNESFFSFLPESPLAFMPHDESIHKSFGISQFLRSKLRWMTLGHQYDWTAKLYPPDRAPPFPRDIGQFLRTLFPSMRPEAAIVNLYQPGDCLNIHRDVSEECNNGLVSISLGCDGIFVAGLQPTASSDPECLAIRLRSGDAIFMGDQARFTWHGLAQVIPHTSPDYLFNWPAPSHDVSLDDCPFEAWRGWMANRRINLSVRQVRD